jgi:hypothetical protein
VKEYDGICEAVPTFRRLGSYDEFVWARMAVITRQFAGVCVYV